MKKILLAILLIGATYFGYQHFFNKKPAGGEMGGAAPVSVAEVKPHNIQIWHEFSGRLVAADSAEIRPRVAGTIEQIHFNEGQFVQKDAPLFTIDRKPYAASLEAAQARAKLAESEFKRAKSLIKNKIITKKDYDQRSNDLAVANADLTKAQLDYDYSIIKSPIAGRVSRAEITVGNLVDAGGNAPVLTSVVASSPIYADFDMDEQNYLNYLQEAGKAPEKLQKIPVNLQLAADKKIAGHIQSFDNRLNPSSGTLRVRAIFANEDGHLIPGLFAHIEMGSAKTGETLLINEQAINTDQNIKFVWVVSEDNKVVYRPIKIGGRAEGLRVVQDGLKVGEKIIINGTQRVMMPGQSITPKLVDMAKP